jgi:hypothetical protein
MKSTHGVVRLAYLKTILANGHTILKLYTYGHTNVTLYIFGIVHKKFLFKPLEYNIYNNKQYILLQ